MKEKLMVLLILVVSAILVTPLIGKVYAFTSPVSPIPSPTWRPFPIVTPHAPIGLEKPYDFNVVVVPDFNYHVIKKPTAITPVQAPVLLDRNWPISEKWQGICTMFLDGSVYCPN